MRFFRSRAARGCGTLALLLLSLMCFALAGPTATLARADTGKDPSWGPIAALDGWHGYAFNQRSRGAAEAAARAQCDRAAGRAGACIVRAYFDRSCGALARGNFGEWATATAPTAAAAAKAAAAQCDGRLPTEPCRVVVSVCSGG